ncbi:hypothetical protein JCM10450v2_004730 [Rhodotorula kratochvilovae]
MLCGLIGHVLNIALLLIVMGATLYYIWPALQTRTFATDLGSLSQYVGAISSAAATLAFVMLAFCKDSCSAGLAMLFAVVDVACYIIWGIKGNSGMVCDGAASLAAEVSTEVAKYIQCDAAWMRTALIVLISVSGSLQLTIALNAAYETCSRPTPVAQPQVVQQALGRPATHMRSLGGGRSGKGRRGRYALVGGRSGAVEEDEEERLTGKEVRRRSSEESSASDEDPWEEKGRK